MTTFVALLRGINVGGRNRLPMAAFRETELVAELAPLSEVAAKDESFALVDNAFYLHAPSGIARSKLAASVEKTLGVPATSRNWRTVQKIDAMLAAMDDG